MSNAQFKTTNLLLRDCLGMPEIPAQWTFEGHADINNPYIPKISTNYKFRKELVRDILFFLTKPLGDALYLSGPTGCGKTSVMMEIAGRLNWPVQNVTARGHLEFSDLVGHHTLVSPAEGQEPVMKFQYGPLSKAMALGHIFILNEMDLMDPSELSGLNDLLEGRPLIIENNGGKVIKPHPLFRFVATGNTCGNGDESGMYTGTLQQNIAAMDRYRVLRVGYPSIEVENEILESVCSVLPAETRNKMIEFANEIRKQFLSEDRQLNLTISTRKLVQWGQLAVQLYGAPNALQMAFDISLLNRSNQNEFEAVDRIAQAIFGQNFWPERSR